MTRDKWDALLDQGAAHADRGEWVAFDAWLRHAMYVEDKEMRERCQLRAQCCTTKEDVRAFLLRFFSGYNPTDITFSMTLPIAPSQLVVRSGSASFAFTPGPGVLATEVEDGVLTVCRVDGGTKVETLAIFKAWDSAVYQ